MVSAATIAVFLLCCYFSASSGSQDDCVYAATGSSFTVPLKHELKESANLRWFKDRTIIFYRRGKYVITGKNDYVDSTGSLKLTRLTKDMSGRYIPEVTNADGLNVGHLPSVRLCVLDPVKKPKVTMTCIEAQKNVSFSCNIGQDDTIEWLMNAKRLAEKGKTVMRVAKDVANSHFSCNVSNIISSEISLPVQQNCYKPVFPDVCDTDVCIPVRSGAGILLLVILTAIVCCTHKKAKVIKDKNELPLKQQHHHQKQPVGRVPEPDFCADCGLEGDNRI
uniref:Ig-like domain-containing protein n=1 Tax=Astatotilapia calliptera TaxID=8154 RepID=A0A3P8NGY0_ASTCA